MRTIISVVVAAFAVLTAVLAGATVISDPATSILIAHGNWTSFGDVKTDPLPKANFDDGNVAATITYLRFTQRNGIGYDFGGLATVTSLYVAQNTTGRKYADSWTMYYSGGSQVVSVSGAATTVTVTPVQTDYVYLVPKTVAGTGFDDPAMTEFYVNGSAPSPSRTNVLSGLSASSITGSNWFSAYNGSTFGSGNRLTDSQMAGDGGGTLQSNSIWINSGITPTSSNNYVQFDMGTAQTVSTLGLCQQLGGQGFDRKIVNAYELLFANVSDFSSVVATYDFTLNERLGYVQNDFPATTARYVRFIATGRDSYGTDNYTGINEVQLFTLLPEPASLLLLALGGLTLLKRQRKP